MKKLLLIFLSLIVGYSFGQTTSRTLISTGGSTFSQGTYQLDWSIGETLIQTYENGGQILSQGFQQGNLIVTGVEDFDINVRIKVFPNPVTKKIKIYWQSFDNQNDSKFQITVTDISGKTLYEAPLQSREQSIDLSFYKSGTYIVVISHGNQAVKSFKIIKT